MVKAVTTHIHILSKGFETENAQAFFYPLIQYRRLLNEARVTWEVHTQITPQLYDCDILMVENNFFRSWWREHTPQVLEYFSEFKDNVSKLIYVDLQAFSTMPHARMLPYVDLYIKKQLLKDRHLYLQPLHGHRLYTHFYHQHFQVEDTQDIWSEPIANADDLSKLRIGWNSSLANYTFPGPYRNKLYRLTGWPWVLKFPKPYAKPRVNRKHDVSCRISTQYSKNTVAFQRQQLADILSDRLASQRVSRRQYYRELAHSKLVISPFGWGEICYRDYEAFLAGSLLLKPDMSHLETWPDLYQPYKTYVPFQWDLSDVRDQIEHCLDHYRDYMDIAQAGQANYQHYLTSPHAGELFCKRFIELIRS